VVTIEWSPQKRKCVTQITDGRGAASYIGDNRTHTLEEGEHVMTWTSDRAGVVLYLFRPLCFTFAPVNTSSSLPFASSQ
jgi:hypothetical protein